jgi:hypothetical protein
LPHIRRQRYQLLARQSLQVLMPQLIRAPIRRNAIHSPSVNTSDVKDVVVKEHVIQLI